jgi:O-antigen/teichoic acid export membrane protein
MRFFKQFLSNSAIVSAGVLFALINTVLFTNAFSMDEYGLIITLFLYSQIIQSVGILGLTELSIKVHNDGVGLKYSADLLFLALTQLIACVPLAILLSLILEIPFALLFILSSVQMGLKLFAIYYRTTGFVKNYNMINSLIFNGAIAVLLVAVPHTTPLDFLKWLSLSISIILIALLLANFKKFKSLKVNQPLFSRNLFRDSFVIGMLVVFNSFFVAVDQLLIGKVEGNSALASYKITLLIFLAGTFPHTVVNSIVGPKVARLCKFKKFRFLKKYFWSLNLFQSILCVFSVIAFFIVLKLFGTRLYPETYMPSNLSFVLLLFASIAVSFRGISTIILIQNDAKSYLFIGQLIFALTLTFVYLFLIELKIFNSMPLAMAVAHIVFSSFILIRVFPCFEQCNS